MFEHGFPQEWSTLKKLIWLVGSGIAGASYIWKTVTGALIHITDALASPMQKCEVALEPIQDLHGQDAPYPAGGGKNLLSLPDETFVQFAEHEIDPIPAGTYIYSGIVTSTDTDGNKCAIIFLDESKNTLVSKLLDRSTGTTRIASSEFTVSSAIKYVRLYASNGYPSGEGDTANFKDNMVCPATASNPTSYAPYSNICPITGWTGCEVWVKDEYDTSLPATASVTFPETVYGGKYDFVSGNGISRGKKVKFKNLTWSYNYGVFYCAVRDKLNNTVNKVLCDTFKAIEQNATSATNANSILSNYQCCASISTGFPYIYFKDTSLSDATTFKTTYGEAEIVYELADPTEISHTPQEISTLAGENNVWSNTNSDTTIIYKAQSS